MDVKPKVTVGVPVYNGERFVSQALLSVMQQDIDGLEILVSDNASTDSTSRICNHLASTDERIRYVRHDENRGGVWNVNYLLAQARAPIFKWAYYDDLLYPGYLQRCLDALESSGAHAVGAHSRVVVIDEDGQQIADRHDAALGVDAATPHERLARLYATLAGQLEFGVFRTNALRSAGGVRPFYGSEFAMLTSILIQGQMVQVPDKLLGFRRHPAQYGTSRFTEMSWYAHEHQRGKYAPYSWMTVEFLRTVLLSEVDYRERARCARAVLRYWTLKHLRGMAGDVKALPALIRMRKSAPVE